MKVKLIVSRSGPDGAHSPGDEIDVPEAEALRMIDAGQCELVRTKTVERTVKKPKAEKAVR